MQRRLHIEKCNQTRKFFQHTHNLLLQSPRKCHAIKYTNIYIVHQICAPSAHTPKSPYFAIVSRAWRANGPRKTTNHTDLKCFTCAHAHAKRSVARALQYIHIPRAQWARCFWCRYMYLYMQKYVHIQLEALNYVCARALISTVALVPRMPDLLFKVYWA